VRLMMMYPPSAGRNFHEILRAVDSLQTSDKYKVATPVDWCPGEPAIIPPSISNEAAKRLFPQRWKELTPYLRIVELPTD
jgi:thioredoxin-dependent peroxiredoxin